ncbi:MAG: hypoxanthine phosphoribosyltransferase [Oscillospiraceae bacterium]|nr:hypoxanthine phosphoribosyltransferase [Oscillospiraceae bacterium]
MLESITKKILVTEEEIKGIVSRLGQEINRDYADKNLVIVCVLKGSVMFAVDLAKEINVVCEMEFVRTYSYGNGTESTGKVQMLIDFDRPDFAECDFLVIEDIVDSGNTLKFLVEHLYAKGAKSVKTCTLLDKPSRRKVDFNPDYIGTEIPDEFVFGYGLDLFEKYRDLPYVAVVSPAYLASLGL